MRGGQFLRSVLVVLTAVVLVLAPIPATRVLAEGHSQQDFGDRLHEGEAPGGHVLGFSDDFTASVLRILREAEQVCGTFHKQFQLDCIRIQFELAARKLKERPDYAEAGAALEKAAGKLQRLVRENEDKKMPRGMHGGRFYKPIKKAALPKVNKQAAAVVRETETILLRATGNSRERRLHYAKIADAVGSATVLLRS
jgi:hypothetical protein